MWTTCSKNSLSRSKSLAKLVSFAERGVPPRPYKFLELQPFFPGRLGQRLHAAVIDIAAAVEDHLSHPALLRPRRHQLADQLRRRLAGGRGADLALHLGIGRVGLR